MLLQGSNQHVQRGNCSRSIQSESEDQTKTACIPQLLCRLVESKVIQLKLQFINNTQRRKNGSVYLKRAL